MDNQKSNEGKGIDANKAGSNIGKSQDSTLSTGATAMPGSQQSASSSGNMGSSSPSSMGSSSPSSSSSSMGSATGSSGSLGNSGMGASSSSQSASTPSSSTPSSSASDASNGQSAGGIKAAISSISPDKVHAGIDKAAQAAQPVVDNLASKAHAGVDKVTGLLSTAQEKFGGGSAQLSEKCSDMSAQGKEYVKNNPGSALLAAVGVGFILAKLLGGSSDRNEYRNNRDYRD